MNSERAESLSVKTFSAIPSLPVPPSVDLERRRLELLRGIADAQQVFTQKGWPRLAQLTEAAKLAALSEGLPQLDEFFSLAGHTIERSTLSEKNRELAKALIDKIRLATEAYRSDVDVRAQQVKRFQQEASRLQRPVSLTTRRREVAPNYFELLVSAGLFLLCSGVALGLSRRKLRESQELVLTVARQRHLLEQRLAEVGIGYARMNAAGTLTYQDQAFTQFLTEVFAHPPKNLNELLVASDLPVEPTAKWQKTACFKDRSSLAYVLHVGCDGKDYYAIVRRESPVAVVQRLEEGKLRAHLAPVSVNDLLADQLALNSLFFQSLGVRVDLVSDEEVNVRFEPTTLARALNGLVRDLARFAAHRAPNKTLKFVVYQVPTGPRLSVLLDDVVLDPNTLLTGIAGLGDWSLERSLSEFEQILSGHAVKVEVGNTYDRADRFLFARLDVPLR